MFDNKHVKLQKVRMLNVRKINIIMLIKHNVKVLIENV